MNKARNLKFVIVAQAVVIGILAVAVLWLEYQRVILGLETDTITTELGFRRAQADFVRGHHWLYEIKFFKVQSEGPIPNDDASVPTGRFDGPYEIHALLTDQGLPASHTELRKRVIDAYNRHMRQMCEHPDWFDANGFRINKPHTNLSAMPNPK